MIHRYSYFLIFVICILSHSLLSQSLDWAFNLGNEEFDEGVELVLDADGNTYVTGSFQEKVDFDPGPAQYFLQSNGYTDVFFAKYDSFGNLIWAKNVGGLYWDFGYSISLDDDGNVLITGNYRNTSDFDPGPNIYNLESNGWYNIFLAKYTNEGALIWAHGFGSSANDIGRSVKSDTAGNIYLTGYIKGSTDFDPSEESHILNCNGENDFYIAKYSADGDFLWAHSFGNSKYDSGNEIAIDVSGNVFVTGFFQNTLDFDPGEGVFELGTNGNADLFFAKYDSDGEFLWAKSIGWWDGESGNCIKLDPSGNIYLAGTFGDAGGPVDFDPGEGIASLQCDGAFDLFIAKYDANGNYIWAKGIGSEGFEKASEIELDNYGNVIIVGSFQGIVDFDPGPGIYNVEAVGDYDGLVLELDSNGNFLWVKTIGEYGWDQCLGVAINNENELFISGHFEGTSSFEIEGTSEVLHSNGDRDIFLAKYKLPCYSTYDEIHQCLGSSFTFPDGTVTESSMLQITHLNSNETCDSLIVISLIMDTLYNQQEFVEICEGEEFVFPDGEVSSISEMHTSMLGASDGCDSIIVSFLTVNPIYSNLDSAYICEGDSYSFPDGTVGIESSTQTSFLLSKNNCDSTITTYLTVYPSYEKINLIVICEGESFTLPDGNSVTSDTFHVSNYLSISGCDSIEIIDLKLIVIDSVVIFDGSNLSVNNTNASYQWLDCTNGMIDINGEIDAIFTPTQSGSYAVQITVGDCVKTSECLEVIISSVLEKSNEMELITFPNPSSGIVYFNEKITGKVRVYDIFGREVKTLIYNELLNEIDLSDIGEGCYIISIEENNEKLKLGKIFIFR